MITRPLSILFIADNDTNLKLSKPELLAAGFDVNSKRVGTPEQAAHALDSTDWDIVISDYQMSKYSAAEALLAMQENKRSIPFIVMSKNLQTCDAVDLLKQGANDYIDLKEPSRLIPVIERELNGINKRPLHSHTEERIRTLSTAVEQSPVSVAIADHKGTITYVNPKFVEVTGHSSDDCVGRNIDFTLQDRTSDTSFLEIWDTITRGEVWSGEFCNTRHDGKTFCELVKISPLSNNSGSITHFIIIREDITARRHYEEQLLRQAHYDNLTGLPNRDLMIDRLDLAIESAMRSSTNGALICLDLDRFKDINDTLGHGFGDELLKEAAQRLNACIRRCDILARMGGDEFIIILPEIHDANDAQHLVSRVVESFNQPFCIQGVDHLITATAGIVLFPEDGNDPETLLRNADLAMNEAKYLGRNRYQFFTEEINTGLKRRLDMETRLRGAIKRGEMALFYQPIVDLETGQPVAYEALLRWQQQDGATCMPNEFVPLAEDVGLIIEIGNWAIATACRELASMLKNTNSLLHVSVNVSPKQLQTRGFYEFVQEQLRLNKLSPEHLELEITERVLVDDTPETHINLNALGEMGVSLSIDDFGTGYSSLSYLQKYSFQTLKIDRSFISDAANNINSARLVETIITMAHSLGLRVIAEGVETAEQLSFLTSRSAICNRVQGFLFGYPTPVGSLIINIPHEAMLTQPMLS